MAEADATSEKPSEELRRNYDTQTVLNSLLRSSLGDVPLEELLRRALDLVLGIPWLVLQGRGAIFLVEDEPDVLVMKARSGIAEPIQQACGRLPFGRCHCGRAAAEAQTQFADVVDERHETTYEGIIPHGHYCVPIVFGATVLGVVNIYVREGHRRDPREEEFLIAVADTLAGIIVRKQAEEQLERTLERLQRTLDGTIQTLAAVVEQKDPYTAGHQRRVTQLATAIAHELGLSDDRVEGLRVAGLLHDIGKIYVPAEILSKPGALTENEFNMIKVHPQATYDTLRAIEFPWPVAQIAAQHHERLDGSGYPAGLRGDAILLEGRILAVADVVEAMSSHRPYRPARGIEAALAEIAQHRGVLYDADAVDACLRLFNEQGFQFQ